MTSLPHIFRKPASIILLLAMVQVLNATYLLRSEGFQAVNSVLFLTCGMGISYFILRVPSIRIERRLLITGQLWPKLVLVLLLLPLSYYISRRHLN